MELLTTGNVTPDLLKKLSEYLKSKKTQALGGTTANNEEYKPSNEPVTQSFSPTPPSFTPEKRTTAEASITKDIVKPEETYSGAINPNQKYGMPVYNDNTAGGYTIDYTSPESETASNQSNESTQGNNAETIGNVSDEDNKVVGNFLNKNIFGGLSEAANPGESLS